MLHSPPAQHASSARRQLIIGHQHARAHALVIAADAGHPAGLILGATVVVGLLAYVVLVISAVVSIIRSRHGGGTAIAWFVFVFVAPFVGSLLWFAIGRPDARKRSA